MIEFSGYLSGYAENYFHKKSRELGQKILFTSMLLLLPMVLHIGSRIDSYLPILSYSALFLVVLFLSLVPKGKKERLEITPKKIFTEDNCIICVADRYTESRLIRDVKVVRDFGEFYEIVFPFGKISDKFICQKNLLIKGTLQEFETLFTGKIIKGK